MASLVQKSIDAGIRITSARKVILEVIEVARDHPNVDTVYRRANELDPAISLATVYRTLGLLEREGLIEKLEVGEGKARFELTRDHHDHLVDEKTGEIHEIRNAELERLKNKIAEDMGFDLIRHRLELYGRKRQT